MYHLCVMEKYFLSWYFRFMFHIGDCSLILFQGFGLNRQN